MIQNNENNFVEQNGYEYSPTYGGELAAYKSGDGFHVRCRIDQKNNKLLSKTTVFSNNEPTLTVHRSYLADYPDTNYRIGDRYVSKREFWFAKNAENFKNANFGKLLVNLFASNDDVGEELPDPVTTRPGYTPSK